MLSVKEADRVACQEFKKRHPLCQVCNDRKTKERHHMKGRHGTNMADQTTWLACCRKCHRWIHDNPKLARERGFLQ